jgi:hypothetical protein
LRFLRYALLALISGRQPDYVECWSLLLFGTLICGAPPTCGLGRGLGLPVSNRGFFILRGLRFIKLDASIFDAVFV